MRSIGERHDCGYDGAGIIGTQLQPASQLNQSLTHSRNAHAYLDKFLGNIQGFPRRKPTAAVLDREEYCSVLALQFDTRGRTSRVTTDVRQGFLDYSKERQFGLSRQPFYRSGGDVDVDSAAFSEPFHI